MKNKRIKILTKNSGIINLQFFDDSPDGMLVIGESKKSVPFNIKRVYYINNLRNKKAVRGKHAHKKLRQIIFCINGSFKLHLDDGSKKQDIILADPYTGIILGPLLWHTMTSFSPGCVILVLSDDYYKKTDYIRDYEQFKDIVSKNGN